jgi:hypothetical protein
MWNKTGWDAGVRADVGVVSIDAVPLAYAAIATWPVPDAGTGGDGGLAGRERMRELGGRLPLLASASTRPPGTAASLAP